QHSQLRCLSDDISANLIMELSGAVSEMDDLSSTRLVLDSIKKLPERDKNSAAQPLRHFDQGSVFEDASTFELASIIEGGGDESARKAILKQFRKKLRHSPYFDTGFWADQDGWQRIALTANSYVFPLLRIKDRDYFQKAMAGNGLALPDSKSLRSVEPVIRRPDSRSLASVEPVITRNSGRSLAALAK